MYILGNYWYQQICHPLLALSSEAAVFPKILFHPAAFQYPRTRRPSFTKQQQTREKKTSKIQLSKRSMTAPPKTKMDTHS